VIVLVKKTSASWWANNRTTLITLLRVAFGFVWLVNGLMKVFWLVPDDITDMIQQASQGQPAWLQPWFSFWTSIISSNPAFMLYGMSVWELTLAFTLLLGFMRKLSYFSGILLSLIIWTVAEGFGGPYGPGSTDIGAAILYPFVFFALLVLETSAGSNRYTLDKLVERHVKGWSKVADTSNLDN
jgi:nitrite reductase (NO-forming)